MLATTSLPPNAIDARRSADSSAALAAAEEVRCISCCRVIFMVTNVLAFSNSPQAMTSRLPRRPPIIRAFSSRDKAAEHVRQSDVYVWERGGIFIVRRRVDGADMVLCADLTWRDVDLVWLKTSSGRPSDPAAA